MFDLNVLSQSSFLKNITIIKYHYKPNQLINLGFKFSLLSVAVFAWISVNFKMSYNILCFTWPVAVVTYVGELLDFISQDVHSFVSMREKEGFIVSTLMTQYFCFYVFLKFLLLFFFFFLTCSIILSIQLSMEIPAWGMHTYKLFSFSFNDGRDPPCLQDFFNISL